MEAVTEQFEVVNRWTNRVQFTAEITCAPDATIGVKIGLAVKWARNSGADLRGAVLRGAVLRGADLRDANLSGADLRGAVLRGAVLRGADLRDANLSGADLSGADLRGAVLRGADLRDANLSGADLSGADLRGAVLRGADLSGADLRGADLRDAVLRSFKADMWMTLAQNIAEIPALIQALNDGRVDGSQYAGDCACLVGTIANAKQVHYGSLEHNSRNPAEQWFLMIREGDKPGDDTGGGFAAGKALEWAEEFQRLIIDPVPA
ncbi:hypothetical protein sphantq_02966 [Sphingobium sp. AntQ-1]|uniref:pentapeptide repeat-containing protein n=1 Tax=Sphingobium sp. AntQ-1 TaxID=2930091 RepID=UPI00234F65F4|nr:pentapeptide repeat-containing protein [Sphingobium sp. AntQ-1]WCP14520.1 hypothetical protein sphantq_02966 [Sphingobium sp. AntQ-1]